MVGEKAFKGVELVSGKLVWIDTNGEGPHVDCPSWNVHTNPGLAFLNKWAYVQDPEAAPQEMSCVVVRMEPNKIGPQDATQDLLSYSSLLPAIYFLPEQTWQQHEVIVVNPDDVIVLKPLCNNLCKDTVYLLVGLPVAFVEDKLSWVVM
ncbi:hypothetical protein EYZ11_007725 [Aspergillus tanneri]|uniref:Uncharacterized protein n=1 Tax=Aspergillus tanneri TaxID=1220188 RepID=A0A4S3JC96_9EURO|nr:hypothetical protein EYZ11_007725 [Aspergillus tanneri]